MIWLPKTHQTQTNPLAYLSNLGADELHLLHHHAGLVLLVVDLALFVERVTPLSVHELFDMLAVLHVDVLDL